MRYRLPFYIILVDKACIFNLPRKQPRVIQPLIHTPESPVHEDDLLIQSGRKLEDGH